MWSLHLSVNTFDGIQTLHLYTLYALENSLLYCLQPVITRSPPRFIERQFVYILWLPANHILSHVTCIVVHSSDWSTILLLLTTSRVQLTAAVVVMSSSGSRLKRSLSLDIGMDSDQPADDGFIPAISRKNRRRTLKKSKVCDHTDNGTDNPANLIIVKICHPMRTSTSVVQRYKEIREMSLSLLNLAVIIAVVCVRISLHLSSQR